MVTGDRNSEQSQFCRGSTTLFNGSRLDHFCDMNHPDLTPILTISHHLLNGWSVEGRGEERSFQPISMGLARARAPCAAQRLTAGCGYVMLHNYNVTQHIDRYRGVKV